MTQSPRNVLVLLLFLVGVCRGQDAPKMTSASTQDATTTRKNLVVELDMRNFDSSIRDGNAWLVEFYGTFRNTDELTHFFSNITNLGD